MNGVHDMGGMDGFGPVVRERNEPVFHEPWEKRVFAIQVATSPMIPLPHSRSLMEQIEPALYLTSTYYERWLRGRIAGLIEAGVITTDELSARVRHYRENPEAAVPRREEPGDVKRILQGLSSIPSPIRPRDSEPMFEPGDSVQVCNLNPAGHTRLPRYVRGKRGIIDRFYGFCDLQDALPPGEKTPETPLYSVRFEGSELWGDSAEESSALYLDMWETYLEPREPRPAAE